MKAKILIGNINCGKSKYCKTQLEDYFIVSKDNLREMIYGYYEYKEQDEKLINELEKSIIIDMAKNNRNIIIDETNHTIKRRKYLVDLVAQWNYSQINYVIFEKQYPIPDFRKGLPKERWEMVTRMVNSQYEPVTNKEKNEFSIDNIIYATNI